MTDFLTVARAHNRRLAKTIKADGSIEGYDQARIIDLFEMPVADLGGIARLLDRLLPRPDCAVVRGKIIDPARTQGVRRLAYEDKETGDQPTLKDCPHLWVALDVDGVARPDNVSPEDLIGCARAAIALLPGEFRNTRCIVGASASHGLKPGCRLRLWFWLSRLTTNDELTRWLKASPVDASVFRTVQPIYTAAPIFEAGSDHLPARIAELNGASAVHVPDLTPPPPPPPAPRRDLTAPDARTMRILQTVLGRLETAPDGQRHRCLRAAAFTIGGLLDSAGIGQADAARLLLDSVRRAGGCAVVEKNATATIAWGLAKGRQSPLGDARG